MGAVCVIDAVLDFANEIAFGSVSPIGRIATHLQKIPTIFHRRGEGHKKASHTTMFFSKAAAKILGRRGFSTTVEESSSGSLALLTAVGTTFVTYMTADFLSNFLQHPTQKVRGSMRVSDHAM